MNRKICYSTRWGILAVALAMAQIAFIPLRAQTGEGGQGKERAALPLRPRAPKSVRLYVFDCGKLRVDDPSLNYGFTRDQLAATDLSVPCFLIVHPKGTLMWETGVLPDSVFSSGPGPIVQGRATVVKPLMAQLAEIGYSPSDIKYLAVSHYHWDHTANANAFASSTWIVQKPDYDAMFSDPPPKGATNPSYYSALKDSKKIILTGKDFDVFGDGTVTIISAPGHTQGHQILLVKLKKTGPVLLVGDLYHYPEERAQGHIPKGDWNRDQTAASRAKVEDLLKKTGAQLWIQHDFTANVKLKKSPEYYE